MTKLEFYERLEAVKSRLPVGVVPLYLKTYPDDLNISRIKNTVAGKIQDVKILKKLEDLAEAIEKVNKKKTVNEIHGLSDLKNSKNLTK